MSLNGQQFGELTAILCETLDRPTLDQLVRVHFNADLGDEVASEKVPFKDVAVGWLKWLEQRGRTTEFVRRLRDERSKVPRVSRFCDSFLTGEPAGPNGSPDPVRAAIDRFADVFHEAQRQDQFRYLNAYKELHDILHDLQSYQSRIEEVVAGRAGGGPIPEDAAVALAGWADAVRRNAAETEFPDNPPAWVNRFVTAVGELTGPDPSRAGRAAERLASLPARAQGELNGELVRCARRLRADQLVVLLDGILSAVGPAAGPGTVELRAVVARFRVLCNQLHELIRDHDLCQKVDDALREAAGLPEVTWDRLADWAEVRTWLDELVANRPGDFRVVRSHTAAKEFEASADPAAATAAFNTFAERFADLFQTTDRTLLKVTNQLPIAAMTLDTVLTRFR